MHIHPPYLLFIGDVPDPLAAKTAFGIVDWRRDWCLAQLRLPGCQADLGLPDRTIAESAAAGAKTLVIGAANAGGVLSTPLGRDDRRGAPRGDGYRERAPCAPRFDPRDP